MAITLSETNYPIRKQLSGSDSVQATARDVIKFKVNDTDILNERVPGGKKWQVYITVKIEESDV